MYQKSIKIQHRFYLLKASIALIILVMIGARPVRSQGLLNRIKQKVEQVATDKIINKTGNAVDKGIDKAIGNTSNKAAAGEEMVQIRTDREGLNAFRKYDFIPGESIFYANDFKNERLGEMPAGWNSNGNAVLVELDKYTGNWLQITQRSTCLTDNTKPFGDNFTVEFDLIMDFDFKGWLPPSFTFGLLSTGKDPSTANKYLNQQGDKKAIEVTINALSDGANLTLESFEKHIRYFHTPAIKNQLIHHYFGKPVHIAMQGQKERMRVWMNGEKIYDVPKAIPVAEIFNNLYFKVSSSPYQDSQVGFYVGNFKLAKGLPDLRHKLLDEGKFSTTGILFDPGSAVVKPESTGIIKEIVQLLNQHPDIKIKIIGHTDSDGEEKSNQRLSEERAANIKLLFGDGYGIDPDRLSTAGKGESEPIADNSQKEGKAQNRRVEFRKI